MINPSPQISAVICTYNRDRFIEKTLEHLANQTLDKSLYEIIVIDNNSTDRTAAITRDFISKHPELDIRYLFEPNKGVSFARNRAIKEVRSNIIVYVDDDAYAAPEFLQNIFEFMNQHQEVVGLGGRVIPIYPEGPEPKWTNWFLRGFVGTVDFGEKPIRYKKSMKYPAGCNMVYRKDILQKAGGFNNNLTFRSDDKYIFFKVQEISPNIYYLPNAVVYHNVDNKRMSFENFKRLFLKTGNEEKVRYRSEGNTVGLIAKFFEYTFKLGASLLIYLYFLITGREIKGRYVVYSQWFTWKGFLQKRVFVR